MSLPVPALGRLTIRCGMRFGLQLPDFAWITEDPHESLTRLRDVAVAAEQSGFHSLWVMDHFYQLPQLGGPDLPMLECYTALGALAAVTSTVRLGALVTGVTYRNPALLAKQVTTLDLLSGGRAVMGIGAAWYDVEHDGLGFTFPPLRERYEMLEEAVRICRAMFTEDKPSFAGRHYRVEAVRNVPKPIQPSGPPIMIGGSGEQKTLRLVARYADACNVFGSADTVARRMRLIDSYCTEEGRDPNTVTRTRLGSLFVCDTEADAEQTRQFLLETRGTTEVTERMTVGTPSQIADAVAAFAEAGMQELIFNLPGIRSIEQVHRAGAALTAGR